MFTSVDKALVALVMSILYVLNTYFGLDVGWSVEAVSAVIGALTPILVWLIPNKPTNYRTHYSRRLP